MINSAPELVNVFTVYLLILSHFQVRNVDGNISPSTSIALDSASSIHLFKDISLLNNIQTDSKKIKVRRSKFVSPTHTFHVKDIGELCDTLKSLPLPSEWYYYYPNRVANILSLALLVKIKRVVLDTAIENAYYVFCSMRMDCTSSFPHQAMSCIVSTSVQVMIHTLWLFRRSRMNSQDIWTSIVLGLKQYADNKN